MMKKQILQVGLAQFAPVWMKREQTIEKALSYAEDAANQNCEPVILGGEGCVSSYSYTRPDVLQLKVNRERQSVVKFEDK